MLTDLLVAARHDVAEMDIHEGMAFPSLQAKGIDILALLVAEKSFRKLNAPARCAEGADGGT